MMTMLEWLSREVKFGTEHIDQYQECTSCMLVGLEETPLIRGGT